VDPATDTPRSLAIERDVEDCLGLLALDAGPERERCRVTLTARAQAGTSAREALLCWFAAVLGERHGDVSLEAARAAFHLAGGAQEWSKEILAPRPSAAFCRALRLHLPVAVPAEVAAPMPPQPLSRVPADERGRRPAESAQR
jgi:hypothetical protein